MEDTSGGEGDEQRGGGLRQKQRGMDCKLEIIKSGRRTQRSRGGKSDTMILFPRFGIKFQTPSHSFKEHES